MALNSTIYKAELILSDMDRHYYHTHNLTLACHPSETEQRLMLRLLAFALHASERLSFGKGLSSEDEPDLWQKDFSDHIELWIDLGQPSEKRLRQACHKSERCVIYCYGEKAARTWWQQLKGTLQRFRNLAVWFIPDDQAQTLAAMAQRSMQLQCTIQDGQLWLSDASHNLAIELEQWK